MLAFFSISEGIFDAYILLALALRSVGLIEVFQKVLYHHLPVDHFQRRPGGSPGRKRAVPPSNVSFLFIGL